MSQYNTGYKCFQVGDTAIVDYARVKLSSGLLVVCSETDRAIGTIDGYTAASEYANVKLRNVAGTHKMIAAGEIAAGATVYGAASGKVNDVQASGSYAIGQALEAASGDGSIIEILPYVGDETAG